MKVRSLELEGSDRAMVMDGPVNIGLVRVDGGLLIVDSGLGGDSARAVISAAAEMGEEIRYVFNTHGHADHIGGNSRLVEKTGARVMAPAAEVPFVTHPHFEPISLAGGAPFRGLQGRFLQAEPSRVDLAVEAGPLPGLEGLEAVPLPGHSPGMLGLRCGGILFSADAFFPPSLISKHGLLYCYHPGRCLESLERLAGERGTVIPSHGPTRGFDLGECLEANRRHILEIREAVLEELTEGLDREELTARLAARFGLADDHVAWALAFGTIQGYLTTLREDGRVSSRVTSGKLLWKKVGVRSYNTTF